MNNITSVIQKAKDFLINNPYDEGHDLYHHLAVWKNAQHIARHIKESADIKSLHIACFWHDVVTTPIENRNFKDRDKMTIKTAEYLQKLMLELGCNKDLIERTIIAVCEHDLNSRPTTIEGKILYDADKLEFLNVKRWIKILDALKTGKMVKIKLFLYKKAGKRWISKLKRMYNFDYTRKLHDKKVNEILNNSTANKIAADLGEDLRKILIGE